MNPEREVEGQKGLSRERLVQAALELIQEEGLDGLSMRGLADRLDVKAASLYWHVRDRGELLELLAESILEPLPVAVTAQGWRRAVIEIAGALTRRVSAQKDAGRVLLEAPDAIEHSDAFLELKRQLQSAGLAASEAADVARMVIIHVIASGADQSTDDAKAAPASRIGSGGDVATVAIDSGSRGVVLRAGSASMQTLVRVAPEQNAAAPAVVRGETVIVRRLRGVGRGEIELNPGRPWRFRVQAPTWNTMLDAGGLDVRDIHVDSGAVRLECFLPRPRGVVPIHISSGVVGVVLHRPRGTAVVADISTGSVKLNLDDYALKTSVFQQRWESEGAAAAADRYELSISSGAVKISLDSYDPKTPAPVAEPPAAEPASSVSALDILLDGVEHRTTKRS